MRYRLIILFLLVVHGCTFGSSGGSSGGCEPGRGLTISRVAPEEGAVTGPDQKFGFLATDSRNEPSSLVGAVRIDNGTWIACEYNSDSDQEIEKRSSSYRGDEYAFRCPVSMVGIGGGSHTFEYSLDGDGFSGSTRKSTTSMHDLVAPTVSASVKKARGQNTIAFQASSDKDFANVVLYVNNVRVTASFEREGELVIDSSIRGEGAAVALRAYDKMGNFTSTILELQ